MILASWKNGYEHAHAKNVLNLTAIVLSSSSSTQVSNAQGLTLSLEVKPVILLDA